MYTFITCYFFCLSRKMLIEDVTSLFIGETLAMVAFFIHLMLFGELIKPIWDVSLMQILAVGGGVAVIPIVILVFLFSYILKKVLKHNGYKRFNEKSTSWQPVVTLKKSFLAFGLIIVPFVMFVHLSEENLREIKTLTQEFQYEDSANIQEEEK